jgi:asparagine synthase (glutamine-hydrolysing)
MCGIAGLVGLERRPVDAAVAKAMADLLAHRGPDGEGLVQPAPEVALAHRRLSIIDVAGGHQPMANEDRTIWLTFNGEIFNYRELRRELQDRGHVFRTRCDAEVVVHLYEESGADCLRRLNGQFAFALWDGKRQQLLCARDPLGIKPFYYYADGRHFAFASEPRAFFAFPELDLSVDLDAVALYFRYHFIPAPRSAYRRVRKLRAGECLLLGRSGVPSVHRYWTVQIPEGHECLDPQSARRELRSALERAVERQMLSDVPIGAFLSGGVDSASIACLAQRGHGEPLRTFTIGLPGKDEREHAAATAAHLGTRHLDAIFDAEQAGVAIRDVLDHIDEPIGDTSFLATYAVSRLAAQHVKVALSGDGGDELFAGYERHARVVRYLQLPPLLRPLWWILRRSRQGFADPGRWRGLESQSSRGWAGRILAEIRDHRSDALHGPGLRDRDPDAEDPIRDEIERHRGLPPLAQVLAVDLQTGLADRLLAKVDRASMWNSLEVRVPLLDIDVVQLAFQLAPDVLLSGGRAKGILRDTVSDCLPDAVLARKKQGFGSPVKRWFARELSHELQERLSDSLAVREGLLDPAALEALTQPRLNGEMRGPRLWRVLALESWLRSMQQLRSTGRGKGALVGARIAQLLVALAALPLPFALIDRASF